MDSTLDLLVVGSANVDLVTSVERPPHRGETVVGSDVVEGPGGKGLNQAVAGARLGLSVAMVAAVGHDGAGSMLRSVLESEGVTPLLTVADRATGRALVLVDAEGDSTITISPGANATVGSATLEAYAAQLTGTRALLLQHEIPEEAVAAAARVCPGLVVLNPAPARPVPVEVLAKIDVLVPNSHELAVLAGSKQVPTGAAEAARMAAGLGLDATVVVTLGGEGAVVVVPGEEPVAVPAVRVEVVDATAAGDTFCAALVDGLLRNLSVVDAARWAVRVAAVTVTRRGAALSVPRRSEVG